MRKSFIILSLILLTAFTIAGCTPAAQPANVPDETAVPQVATTTSSEPTTIPTPVASPTPSLIKPPADRFLPAVEDLGEGYAVEDSLLSENIAAQAALPVPPDSLAVASFRNTGTGAARATDPQNGLYYRMTWWVVLAESEANARFLFSVSQSKDYAKNAFLLIMPAALQGQMGEPQAVALEKGSCNDAALSSYISDTYAAFRGDGPKPTVSPLLIGKSGGASADALGKLPPDLFLYGACRVRNAVILFWGHTPDNYDGQNSPLPPEVVAKQVMEKMDLVINKLK